jgi:hypothetical protein
VRDATPTREELVAEYGREQVEHLEGLGGMDGLDLVDRVFVWENGEPYAGTSVGDAYRRGRETGECPAYLLPDFFWEHWDIDGLCDMFPCPGCFDDSMFRAMSDPDNPRPILGPDEDEDEEIVIPF